MTATPKEDEEGNAIIDDLTTLQAILIENIDEVKKHLASTFNSILLGVLLTVVIIGGLILSIDIGFFNFLALLLALVAGLSLLTFRYFYCTRPIDSALEYVNEGKELKEHKSIPFIDKLVVFNSPTEVYDASVKILDPEWTELVPLFEESLKQLKEAEDEEVES